MESFIKDNIIMNKEFNSLNIFESIQELQKMIPFGCDKLFIEMESKYKRLIREEIQKMGIHPFYTAYCLKHAAIQKLVRSKIELSKINKVARFALDSTIALGYYSLYSFQRRSNSYINGKRCYTTSRRKS
jgi:hypothetical protein